MIGHWTLALAALLIFAIGGWVVSLIKRDVSIVDGMWPLMFLVAGTSYVAFSAEHATRAYIILLLVFVWSVRLSAHIFIRNHGADEDYRYQQIRERNSPYFGLKSLYIVFGLQAVLAWIISLPLLAATVPARPLGFLDLLGAALWLTGFLFESIGDYQLTKFRASPTSKGKVLDTGLWRFTRHPNYFGDFCVWWGFYLIALSAGLWWSIVSPLLMSLLLLKVSGVSLLEKDIGDRRPKYAQYAARTNAFFPGPRKRLAAESTSETRT
jgi:steroid 5-alpha reductase family enzyme